MAFTTCDVREGWRIEFPPLDVAGVHLVLAGADWIAAAGSSLSVAENTFVLIPAGIPYVFESAPGAALFLKLYNVPELRVLCTPYNAAFAFKATLPRLVPAGVK